jgi:acyl-CoA reductase-like NAD-dependent aldehyde dehydrogenase
MSMTAHQAFDLRHRDRFFIGGEWVMPSTSSVFDIINPVTEERTTQFAEAQAADIDRAVAAARDAFDSGPWPRMKPAKRATYLRAIAEGIRKRADQFAALFAAESGIALSEAIYATDWGAARFDYFADEAEKYPFIERHTPRDGGNISLLVREPIGVVGAILSWNSGVTLIGAKLGAALLAGCTVVLKSSLEAAGEAYLFAEVLEEVGLPAGVVNVLAADREVSELLVRDPRVDKISFTGSTQAGRKVAAIMSERIGRYGLELGGKSAALIFDDYEDLPGVATMLAKSGCRMTGQSCSSLTRIVITAGRYDEFVDLLTREMKQIKVGDPFDPETEMGPFVSARQREIVERYIEIGKQEGARITTGGGRPKHLDRGFFIEPTLFADVDNSSTIAQEEIFGPVLCVIKADDENHAIELANDSIYGLNATVFSNDIDRVYEASRRLRSGTVGHNGPRSDFLLGFGGFKQSGIGREGGHEGINAFVEVKVIVLDDEPAAIGKNTTNSKEGVSS